MASVGKVRAKRLDFATYDPPASHLVTLSEVAETIGYTTQHTLMTARDNGNLWAINVHPEGKANWLTTWRAVADWMTSGAFRGPLHDARTRLLWEAWKVGHTSGQASVYGALAQRLQARAEGAWWARETPTDLPGLAREFAREETRLRG